MHNYANNDSKTPPMHRETLKSRGIRKAVKERWREGYLEGMLEALVLAQLPNYTVELVLLNSLPFLRPLPERDDRAALGVD